MTTDDWAQIFDLVRAFVAGGICIGLAAGLLTATTS